MKLPLRACRACVLALAFAVVSMGCQSTPKMGEVKVEDAPSGGWSSLHPSVLPGGPNAFGGQ